VARLYLARPLMELRGLAVGLGLASMGFGGRGVTGRGGLALGLALVRPRPLLALKRPLLARPGVGGQIAIIHTWHVPSP
jgi:hypothetical protein